MHSINMGHWLPLLFDVAVKSLTVSAAALAALVCLRRASAATRHLVLLAGLGVLLGLPALMALLPRQELPRPAALPHAAPATTPTLTLPAPTAQPIGEASTAPLDAAPITALSPLPLPSAETPAAPRLPLIRPTWLLFGWLLGVLVCTGRMLTVYSRVRRLTRRCPPLASSLLTSAGAETVGFAALKTGPAGTPPMVWGWPRPTLLLPSEAAEWPLVRLRAVLLHESAHVRRQDWLTQTVAQAACALYWFNPLVWLLAARLGAEAERACDDAVLLAGVPPTDYAQELLAVARHLGAGRTARRAWVGAVTMARRSPVRGRLEAILDTRRVRRRLTRRSAALALAAALAIAAPLAVLRPAARADEAPAGQATPTAGVPTEADIAKVQRHLQSLERDRLVYDWAGAQPNMLTAAQTALVDSLIQESKRQHGFERFDAREKADNQRLRAEAKKPHTKKEREQIWGPIFAYEHTPPSVIKRQHDFDQGVARLKAKVDRLDTYQVVRETRMYAFDSQVAWDKTQLERMQMERDLGYPLHVNADDFVDTARWGLELEKSGEMTRANRVHLFLLNAKVMQGHPLTDADLESALAILRAPSTHPGEAHAYVIAVFLDARTTIIAQQQKIREAVRPLLTSPDMLDQTYSKAVFRRYGESVPVPMGAAPSSQRAIMPQVTASPPRRQLTKRPAETEVPPMTPLRSIKSVLLKTAAFAAGLTLPAAHAQSVTSNEPALTAQNVPTVVPTPDPKTAAPLTPTAPTGLLRWANLAMRHTSLGAIRALTHWDRGSVLPEGVDRIFFLESKDSVLIHATPAGIAHMQEIIKAIDVAPQSVQVKVAAATVTELNDPGIHFNLLPEDGSGIVGKSPQRFIQGATGGAAAYLAALTSEEGKVFQSSVITAGNNMEATVVIADRAVVPDTERAELGVTTRPNGDNSFTLQIRLTRPGGAPATGIQEITIRRTIKNGETLVLVNPIPGVKAAKGHYFLLFITPTIVPSPNPSPVR